ncbi:MAG: type IIL restriction-modification enzyme MmeI [Halomonas sp.]|uniref:type IIL restriction-modification enzyme MmeI n=1 Tax=Halomonas sp. TaxID=1486246 RepID=UPI003F8EEEA8
MRTVDNISPYLLEGDNTVIASRRQPLVGSSKMILGSMAKDGGNLILTRDEVDHLLEQDPIAEQWVKKLLGSDEFMTGKERWCLWLEGASLDEVQAHPLVWQRVQHVKEMRLNSKAPTTQKFSATPHLFAQRAQPQEGKYILVPRVTSERRHYAPVGFFDHTVIATDLVQIIPNGTLYDFAILSTQMHMDWLRLVGGRLESRYRYSATIVYNTFPWPEAGERQRKTIEALGREVILTRADYPGKTMAELYDPDKMPADLLEAHQTLDRAVEKLYRDRPFRTTAERQEYLLARYETLIEAEKRSRVGTKR